MRGNWKHQREIFLETFANLMEGDVLFGRPEDQEGGKGDLENVAERDEGQMVILDAGGGEVGRDEVVVEGNGGGEVEEEVVHEGGCHCGAVGWRVRASPLPTGGVGWELV